MDELIERIKAFVAERNWKQFHSPKNLAIGISVEANELLDIFMWLSEEDSRHLSNEQIKKVRDEIGDITINLLNFCTTLEIDPIDCALKKLEVIKEKYPIDKSYGSAKKYNEL